MLPGELRPRKQDHLESSRVERFLEDTKIEIIWSTGREVWKEAGLRYGRYARDRRQNPNDGGPR